MSDGSPNAGQIDARPITVPIVRERKSGPKLTMVTAYDHPSASIASAAGIDIILVGDSVANVVHGFEKTLSATVDLMILHAAAVNRAKPHSLVVVDMPWMSYHVTVPDAVRNAGRLVAEGGAEHELPEELVAADHRAGELGGGLVERRGHHAPIEHPQASFDFGGEIDMTRSIDQIDLNVIICYRDIL